MRRFGLLTLALLLGITLAALPRLSRPAAAGEVWCWDDPVIDVNGVSVSISLGVRQTDLSAVSVAEIIVSMPQGAVGRVAAFDYTYLTPIVRFETDYSRISSPVQQFTVTIRLNATRALDYQVVVIRQENKQHITETSSAQANQPVSLSFQLN